MYVHVYNEILKYLKMESDKLIFKLNYCFVFVFILFFNFIYFILDETIEEVRS